MLPIFWISYGVLWVIVAIQGFAFLEMLRQVGLIRKQLAPQQGALIVPDAVTSGGLLPELSGLAAGNLRPARWDDYLHPKISVLVSLTTHCISCRAIADELTGFASDMRSDATIFAIVEGTVDEAQAFINETGLDPRMVIIDEGGVTTKRLGISWNPGAVTIRERRIGEAAIVNSVMQIDALVHGNNPVRDTRSVKDGVPA